MRANKLKRKPMVMWAVYPKEPDDEPDFEIDRLFSTRDAARANCKSWEVVVRFVERAASQRGAGGDR